MKAALILVTFAVTPAFMHFVAKPALNWFSDNVSLYSETFGYGPWLLIGCAALLYKPVLNRLRQ